MLSDPNPARRVARVLNAFRVSLDQSISEFYRRFAAFRNYSKSRRVLAEHPILSVDALRLIADRIAPKLDLTPPEFVAALFQRDPNSNPRLAEYLLATPWPGNRRLVNSFADFLVSRMKNAARILYVTHFLPPWVVAPPFRLRTAWCAAGSRDMKKLRADMVLARKLHQTFIDGVATQRILCPLIRSEFEKATRRHPPFDGFTDVQMSEICDELRNSEQALPAIIDDECPSFPSDFRHYVRRYSSVILIDNTLLAKQFPGRRGWLMFDREQGPDVGYYIDRERRFLADLRHWVVEPGRTEVQEAFASFGR